MTGWGLFGPGAAISLSVGLTPNASYALLTMTVEQVLSTGGYGPPVDLAFGGTAVPEPASWAMMIAGFSGLGGALQRDQNRVIARSARP